jgi:class 3 adenylate cyclase/pimeloyl-ACP methyl ester carboxylesterase
LEPVVQYARAADGVRIAYWSLGEGKPLVVMPSTPFSHVQLEWEIPECRDWYQRLMAGRRLVRYDARGFGLSDRQAVDFSLEAQVSDLQALADKLGCDPIALFAPGEMGIVAIAYADRFPDRVSHLVFWASWARRADVSQTPVTRTLRALVEQDWEIYTETLARVLLGWGNEALAQRFAAFYRECTTPEVLRAFVPAVYKWDATPMLSRVNAPVLVLHRREMPSVPVRVATDLAAGFPDGRLVLLEGRSPLPWIGDMGAVLRAVRSFLGDDDVETAEIKEAAAVPAASGLVTILFTDMEGSTPQRQRLGDAAAQEVLRAHNSIVREALKAHGGSEIKHTGDGIMTSFSTASGALECAITVQRACAEHNKRTPEPLKVRIGLHAGEPIAEEGDLFGTAVVMAERICGKGAGGDILVSDVVRGLVAGKGFTFADRGEMGLKGFEEPVRLFEVRYPM